MGESRMNLGFLGYIKKASIPNLMKKSQDFGKKQALETLIGNIAN